MQQVSDFTYLGVIISSGGTIDRELTARIQKASGAFNQLSYTRKNRNIQTNIRSRSTKLWFSRYCFMEAKKQHHRLEVFDQRCLRRILTRNVDVLECARINPIETFVGAIRLNCAG